MIILEPLTVYPSAERPECASRSRSRCYGSELSSGLAPHARRFFSEFMIELVKLQDTSVDPRSSLQSRSASPGFGPVGSELRV